MMCDPSGDAGRLAEVGWSRRSSTSGYRCDTPLGGVSSCLRQRCDIKLSIVRVGLQEFVKRSSQYS